MMRRNASAQNVCVGISALLCWTSRSVAIDDERAAADLVARVTRIRGCALVKRWSESVDSTGWAAMLWIQQKQSCRSKIGRTFPKLACWQHSNNGWSRIYPVFVDVDAFTRFGFCRAAARVPRLFAQQQQLAQVAPEQIAAAIRRYCIDIEYRVRCVHQNWRRALTEFYGMNQHPTIGRRRSCYWSCYRRPIARCN